jgi:hypothetical protein
LSVKLTPHAPLFPQKNYLPKYKIIFKIFNFQVNAEICALLGYYAASSGNPLPTIQDNVSVPMVSFLLGLLDP